MAKPNGRMLKLLNLQFKQLSLLWETLWLVWAVQPESERRACDHRVGSGTWEAQCTP